MRNAVTTARVQPSRPPVLDEPVPCLSRALLLQLVLVSSLNAPLVTVSTYHSLLSEGTYLTTMSKAGNDIGSVSLC